jgi:hypothetical protein
MARSRRPSGVSRSGAASRLVDLFFRHHFGQARGLGRVGQFQRRVDDDATPAELPAVKPAQRRQIARLRGGAGLAGKVGDEAAQRRFAQIEQGFVGIVGQPQREPAEVGAITVERCLGQPVFEPERIAEIVDLVEISLGGSFHGSAASV